LRTVIVPLARVLGSLHGGLDARGTATFSQYFSGDERDRLDRLLSRDTPQHRQERVARARRGLAGLRRFDRRALSPAQRVSARVMEWQLGPSCAWNGIARPATGSPK
jgi:hypothetical protein